MLAVEGHCLAQGFTTAYLTTHDKQMFYSRCGYQFSESVCAFGGSSSLKLGNFAKTPTASQTQPTTEKPSVNGTPSNGAPTPPQTADAPPLPPPPPPSSKISSQTNSVVASPSPDLVLLCAKAFSQPSLPATLPFIENVPDIDMSLRNEKNSEDSNEKMFMKKCLL